MALKNYIVRNSHEQPVERGGVVFQENTEKEYRLNHYQYAQVKACVYLEIFESGHDGPLEVATTSESGETALSSAATKEGEEGGESLVCPECGYEAQSKAGKASHMRKHEAESSESAVNASSEAESGPEGG